MREPVAGEEIPQLMDLDARGIPDDHDRGEATTLALGPLSQEALDDEMEALVRGCGRLGEVVVELTSAIDLRIGSATERSPS